uniref:leucine--tRNA ligase n=1 Tax=Parastrongyloides trichosuri TaxID=131310 RepID=A0A0N5A586_PARTI
MILLLNSRKYLFNQAKYTSTYLQWPLKENKELSSNLKNIENHWKEIGQSRVVPKKKISQSKYILSMFPYPSGNLHMGHMRVYTISDALARYYSLQGFNIIHPMGWDAFGLPAENAAIERGIDSKKWTFDNINVMREQLKKTGIIFDWDREIFTCDPSFYKWTQWIFLKLSEAGLVRRSMSEVNWDPIDKTVLAAEQIDNEGRSWRSGAIAEKKKLRQWVIETTKYAKKLKDGLELIKSDWNEVADIQSNWIGICDVYKFNLPLKNFDGTLMDESLDLRIKNALDIEKGQFVIIGKDHQLVKDYGENTNDKYYVLKKIVTMNVVTGKRMPIVVENYNDNTPEMFFNARLGGELLSNEDKEISNLLNLSFPETKVRKLLLSDVQEIAAFGGYGGYQTSRTLQDWVVSRQRKWGTPIPMLISKNDEKIYKRVPYNNLPIEGHQQGISLTNDDWILESDTLDTFFDSSWYFLRYLDVTNDNLPVSFDETVRNMPIDVYVGGIEHAAVHLFFARFISHFLKDIGISNCREPFQRLLPQGIVKGKTFVIPETNKHVRKENVIENNKKIYDKETGKELNIVFEKMSKSKHNGVDPLNVLENDGIDLTRLQLLSSAAPKSSINWGDSDLKGLIRWIDRMAHVINIYINARKEGGLFDPSKVNEKIEKELRDVYNFHIRTITMCLEDLHLHNTAITKLIGLVNVLKKVNPKYIVNSPEYERCLHAIIIILQVFAPHISQELWSSLKNVDALNIHMWDKNLDVRYQKWPEIDKDCLVDVYVYACNINCGRVFAPRQEIEQLKDDDIFKNTSQVWHSTLFNEFKNNGHIIKDYTIKRKEGRFYTINLNFKTDTTERNIKDLLDLVSKRRNTSHKIEKRKSKVGNTA